MRRRHKSQRQLSLQEAKSSTKATRASPPQGTLHGQKEDENEGALSPPPLPTACTYHLLSQNRIFWSLWPLMMMWSPHTTSLQ